MSPMKTLRTSGLRSDHPEESRFVILNPSQPHDLQEVFYLNLPDNRSKDRSFLIPGSRVLQLSMWSWYYSPTITDEYRQRWKEKGILWSQPIISEPMPFIVAKGRNGVRYTR